MELTKSTKSNNYKLIDSISDCTNLVENILLKQTLIAVDCEGIYLSKEGSLTLIQICLQDGRVFLFDILKGGSKMFLGLSNDKRGLKSVLENKKILKILHDVRSDWDSLLHQYSVRMYNFIDTQEAFFVYRLFFYQEITLPISLMNLIADLLKINLEYKNKFKLNMSYDPNMWGVRPLSEKQLAYASEDVIYLIEAWKILNGYLTNYLEEIVCFLTIMKVVDTNVFYQFKEYLIANVFYYKMLNDVFPSKDLCAYYINIDFVYNFMKIKIISENANSSDEEKNSTEISQIIKLGMHFKIKQKMEEKKKIQDVKFDYTRKKFLKNNFKNFNQISDPEICNEKRKYNINDECNLKESVNNCKPASPCFNKDQFKLETDEILIGKDGKNLDLSYSSNNQIVNKNENLNNSKNLSKAKEIIESEKPILSVTSNYSLELSEAKSRKQSDDPIYINHNKYNNKHKIHSNNRKFYKNSGESKNFPCNKKNYGNNNAQIKHIYEFQKHSYNNTSNNCNNLSNNSTPINNYYNSTEIHAPTNEISEIKKSQ